MEKRNRAEHAIHNQKVCEHLIAATEYHDWIITTAFYSALHYIESHLFPNKYTHPVTNKTQTINTFNEYCWKINGEHKSKHDKRLDLVEEMLPDICDDYQTLKDACWTARYTNYKSDQEVSKLCYKALKNIEALYLEDVTNV